MGDGDWLPPAYFGRVGTVPAGLPYDDADSDDELDVAPPDVMMLEFDLLELEN